jgi:hypothetical protein
MRAAVTWRIAFLIPFSEILASDYYKRLELEVQLGPTGVAKSFEESD